MATRKKSTSNTIGNGGGLNCTFAYPHYEGKKKSIRAYRVRAVAVAHGLVQVASESHARETRAFYPHRRSQAQFSVTMDLMGRRQNHDHCEHERFNTWLRTYMNYLLAQDEISTSQNFPVMSVSIPVRNFSRLGIPLGPIQYGEHVGSILWRQTISFETTQEPGDSSYSKSRFLTNGTEKDKNARFFYPGTQQLSGNQKPPNYDGVYVTAYDSDIGAPAWNEVNNALNGTGPQAPSSGQGVTGVPGGYSAGDIN